MNSTLIEFIASPGDGVSAAAAGRILEPIQESVQSEFVLPVLIDHSRDGFCHEARHGFICRRCMDAEFAEQRLRQAKSYIFVLPHEYKCIT